MQPTDAEHPSFAILDGSVCKAPAHRKLLWNVVRG
jgi:hypothetical protein